MGERGRGKSGKSAGAEMFVEKTNITAPAPLFSIPFYKNSHVPLANGSGSADFVDDATWTVEDVCTTQATAKAEEAMSETPGNDADLISAISSVLERRLELGAAYLHGSAATGRATSLSDIDIAVVAGGSLSPKRRGVLIRELTVALERAYPGTPFDVRFLDELPVSIRGRVVTQGRRVLDRDPAQRLEAEVRARMEYHDFLVFEREGTREGLRGLRRAARHG